MVTVLNGDRTGIDFNLEVPPGGLISGRVSDADTGIPMPDVHMLLMNEFGNHLVDTSIDQYGNYYFSGLTDGNYKVLANGVPEGYAWKLFPDVACHEWSCDPATEGGIINISAAATSSSNDIALDFSRYTHPRYDNPQ